MAHDGRVHPRQPEKDGPVGRRHVGPELVDEPREGVHADNRRAEQVGADPAAHHLALGGVAVGVATEERRDDEERERPGREDGRKDPNGQAPVPAGDADNAIHACIMSTMPPYTATSPMKRFLSAGSGEPATIGAGPTPKNQGWHTVTEPDTTPLHDFQVNGELGNDAPHVIAAGTDQPADDRHRQQSCNGRLAPNVRAHFTERRSHPGKKPHPANAPASSSHRRFRSAARLRRKARPRRSQGYRSSVPPPGSFRIFPVSDASDPTEGLRKGTARAGAG